MAALTDDMADVIRRAGLSFVATVCPDGTPNLSPKGSVTVLDDEHLVFADIRSPQTVANLRHNPSVEVNAVDFFRRRGYRFKGTAEILDSGPVYDQVARVLWEREGPQNPVHAVVKIRVERAEPLLSPAYVFREPVPSEDEVKEVFLRRYGVRQVGDDVATADSTGGTSAHNSP
jgi:general stress protein 26